MVDNLGITSAVGGTIGATTAPDHPIFTPPDLPGLYLWYAADHLNLADGSLVGALPNAGSLGAAGDFSQATAAKKPSFILNGKNGLPILRFDGVDDELVGNWGAFQPFPQSWYINLKKRGAVINEVRGILDTDGPNWRFQQAFGAPPVWNVYSGLSRSWVAVDNAWNMFLHQMTGDATAFSRQNRVLKATGSIGTFQFGGGVVLGRTSAPNMDMDFGELLVYSPGLSSASDRALVEDYLVAKWGS